MVDLFRHVLTNVWRALYRWSITEGMRRVDLDREDPAEGPADITSTLMAMKANDQRGIYLLLDVMPYLGYADHATHVARDPRAPRQPGTHRGASSATRSS